LHKVAITIGCSLFLAGAITGCGSTAKPAAKNPKPTATVKPTQTNHSSSRSAVIEFGTGLKGLSLKHAQIVFGKTTALSWVANFGHPPTVTHLTWEVTQISGPGTHPRIVITRRVTLGKHTMALTQTFTPAQLKSSGFQYTSPATQYVMVYRTTTTTLAQGKFQLSNCITNCGTGTSGY